MSESGTRVQLEKQDLVITRIFNAPVPMVWRAWTEPELLTRWWGPDHFTCPSAVMDVRVGGLSILCMRAPKEFGGQDFYSTWKYVNIVPMEMFELIHNLSDSRGNSIDPVSIGMPADFPRDQRHVVAFKDLGNNKTEVSVTEFGWVPGQMMVMAEMGMKQSLEKMAAIFSRED